MSEGERPRVGSVLWHDLTVPDAGAVRDFYEGVVGWGAQPVEMEGYSDFAMSLPGSDEVVAGICHARGPNADIPPQWLIYIIVEDVHASAARCAEMGGEVVTGPRSLDGARFCVIRDPAGAISALYQPAE